MAVAATIESFELGKASSAKPGTTSGSMAAVRSTVTAAASSVAACWAIAASMRPSRLNWEDLSSSAASNGSHPADHRCCRWGHS